MGKPDKTKFKKISNSTQLQTRMSMAQKTHLVKAAEDCGFTNLSEYVRTVLLAKHVVVVNGRGVVVVPADAADRKERDEIMQLFAEILEQIAGESSQTADPGEIAPPDAPLDVPSDPAPSGVGAGGAPAGDGEGLAPEEGTSSASSSPKTSPDEGDGSVGADASPPSSHRAISTHEEAGRRPGPEEMTAERAAEELAAEVEPGELSQGAGALGPELQGGETGLQFIERRTEELRQAGRPMIVAKYEAESELRRLSEGLRP